MKQNVKLQIEKYKIGRFHEGYRNFLLDITKILIFT